MGEHASKGLRTPAKCAGHLELRSELPEAESCHTLGLTLRLSRKNQEQEHERSLAALGMTTRRRAGYGKICEGRTGRRALTPSRLCCECFAGESASEVEADFSPPERRDVVCAAERGEVLKSFCVRQVDDRDANTPLISIAVVKQVVLTNGEIEEVARIDAAPGCGRHFRCRVRVTLINVEPN